MTGLLDFAAEGSTNAIVVGSWRDCRQDDSVVQNHAQGAADPGPLVPPGIVEGSGDPARRFDGKLGLVFQPSPFYQILWPQSGLRIYSQPTGTLAPGASASIANKDDGQRKPRLPGGWELSDICRKDGSRWLRYYKRDAGGVARWAQDSDQGFFAREVGRADLIVLRDVPGATQVWINRQLVAEVPSNVWSALNDAPLRLAHYGGKNGPTAFFTGYLQWPVYYAGVLSTSDIAAMPAAVSLVEQPKPPSAGCQTHTTGFLDTSYARLGVVPASAPLMMLRSGGDARYDFAGTIREVPLVAPPQNLTWAGGRTLVSLDMAFPETARAHKGACVFGGAIICPNMEPRYDWGPLYQSSLPRATIHLKMTDQDKKLVGSVQDMHFTAMRSHACGWDFWSVGLGTRDAVRGILIDWCAITALRDDAIENDNCCADVTVADSYVQAFVFYSCRNPSGSYYGGKRISAVQRCVVEQHPCNFKGKLNYAPSFFKLDKNALHFDLIDNTFAVHKEAGNAGGDPFGELTTHSKLASSSGNVICWLGKDRYPKSPPPGFAVLEGAEAKQHLESAKAAFWTRYAGHRFDFDPVAEGKA